jgi:hypothetical protein
MVFCAEAVGRGWVAAVYSLAKVCGRWRSPASVLCECLLVGAVCSTAHIQFDAHASMLAAGCVAAPPSSAALAQMPCIRRLLHSRTCQHVAAGLALSGFEWKSLPAVMHALLARGARSFLKFLQDGCPV